MTKSFRVGHMVAFGSEEDGPRLGILFRDGVFFLSCSVIYLWPLESVVQVHRINPLIIGESWKACGVHVMFRKSPYFLTGRYMSHIDLNTCIHCEMPHRD
ncbi:hypothetical protein SNK03_000802 [Fusarium graminearum]